MRTYILLLATLALGVIASPLAAQDQSPNEARSPLLDKRACKHKSTCSWFNAGKCETYCRPYGGFDVMMDCYLGQGACCCNK